MFDLPKRSLAFEFAAMGFLLLIAVWTWGNPPKREPPKVPAVIAEWRSVLDRNIAHVFTDPVSPWVAGLLLGDDSGFSRKWKDAFRVTGTSHLTAVSGYNVSVVFGLVETVTLRLAWSRRLRLTAGIGAIIFFVFMTGLPASVLRAAVMAIVVMIARESSRPIRQLRALLIAVTFLVMLKPTLLLYDLGFQLSVLATFGLAAITEALHESVFPRLPKVLGASLAETTAATLVVAPMIAYRFGTYSVIALIANVAVMAVIPFLMALGAVILILSFFTMPVAQIAARMTDIIFLVPLHVIHAFSRVPHASLYGRGATLSVMMMVIGISAALWMWWKKKGKRLL